MFRLAATALLVLSLAPLGRADGPGTIPWEIDLDQAFAKAQENRKLVLLYVEDSI